MEKKRVIALGFFDGVHLGHGALLQRVGEVAQSSGMIPSAFTFDTHPTSQITGATTPLINTPRDRADMMRQYYHIQDVMIAHFDREMMEMPWRDFVSRYLVENCRAGWLVAGHDFHFGYKGEGNPQRLLEYAKELGIGCDIIPKVDMDGITISSTYIRTLIAQGEMDWATAFLGHPHILTNQVGHGKKLGRMLGFPTVNLTFPEGVLVPAHGVYATKIGVEGGREFLAVTNIGTRPTVEDGDAVTVEGFILDFEGDLYGKRLRVEFHHKIREERKFESLEALRDEVMKNVDQTRDYFAQ